MGSFLEEPLYLWETLSQMPEEVGGKLQVILMHCSRRITNPFLMMFCCLAKILNSNKKKNHKNKELARVASDTRLLFFFLLETVWHRTTAPWLSNVSTSISSVLAHSLNPSRWPARKHRLAHAGEIYKCCMGLAWLVYKPLIELLWKIQPAVIFFPANKLLL